MLGKETALSKPCATDSKGLCCQISLCGIQRRGAAETCSHLKNNHLKHREKQKSSGRSWRMYWAQRPRPKARRLESCGNPSSGSCKSLCGFGFFICDEGVGLRLLWMLTSYNFVIPINSRLLGAGNLATRSSFWRPSTPYELTLIKDLWRKREK